MTPEQALQFRCCFDHVISPPIGQGHVAAAIAIGRRDGQHAGRLAGLDIAQVVADVDRAGRRDAEPLCGQQQRLGGPLLVKVHGQSSVLLPLGEKLL
jgi:hypothetical protein